MASSSTDRGAAAPAETTQRYSLRFAKTHRAGYYVANFKDPRTDLGELQQPVMGRVPRYKKSAAPAEVDTSIAPSAQRVKAFRSKTKVVYKHAEADVLQDRLDWALQDAPTKRTYVGKPSGGMGTGHYVFFMHENNGFRVVPVRKWVNFKRDWPEAAGEAEELKREENMVSLQFKTEKEEKDAVDIVQVFRQRLMPPAPKVKTLPADPDEDVYDDDDEGGNAAAGGRLEDDDPENEMDFDEVVDDDVAQDASETLHNTSARFGKRRPAHALSKAGEDLFKAVTSANKQINNPNRGKKIDVKPEPVVKAEPMDVDEGESSPPKKARTDDSPEGSPAASPGSSGAGESARLSPDTLLTETEVRSYVLRSRPSLDELQAKFKSRFKQNKQNRQILKDLITRLCVIDTGPDGVKRVTLKQTSG